jgi:Putative auto-transporter adhesin, head GIN domain
MMTKKLFLILVFAALVLSSCMFIPDVPATVIGSGNVVSETREATGFTSVSLDGAEDVNIKFGDAESVVITGEDNIIFLIETNVQNHQLVIKTKPQMTYVAKKPITIDVTVVALDQVALNGSGNMNVSGYTGNSLTVGLDGSGNMILDGTADNLKITLGGSGNIEADQLQAKSATAVLNGSGNIMVYASDSLDATVSGSGNIRYSGNPAHVNKNVSGSGSISE